MALLLSLVTMAGVDGLPVLLACCSSATASSASSSRPSVLALEEHGTDRRHGVRAHGHAAVPDRRGGIAVASLFFDGTPLPMVAGIACCAAVTLVLAQATLHRRRFAPAPAE